MIPARRWLLARGLRIKAWHLALVGAGIGFLSGMVASTGPINTPFFLAYGLVKGAYLSTEALGSMAIGITKAIVFQRFDALPLETVGRGLLIGASLMVGSRLAKGFVLRLDARAVPPAHGLPARRRRARAAVGRVRPAACVASRGDQRAASACRNFTCTLYEVSLGLALKEATSRFAATRARSSQYRLARCGTDTGYVLRENLPATGGVAW